MKRSDVLEIVYAEIKMKIRDLEVAVKSYDDPDTDREVHELAIYKSIKRYVLELMRDEEVD